MVLANRQHRAKSLVARKIAKASGLRQCLDLACQPGAVRLAQGRVVDGSAERPDVAREAALEAPFEAGRFENLTRAADHRSLGRGGKQVVRSSKDFDLVGE